MLRINSIPSLLARTLATTALLTAGLGCREDSESPTGPEPTPGLAAASAQALSFSQVAAGAIHQCAVATDGQAYCWGSNDQGQLGDGTTTNRPTPVAVTGGLRFRHLSLGFQHTCGATTDDRVYCWGFNWYGQLGDGTGYPTNIKRLTPIAVAGGRRFRQVRSGHDFTCALTRSDAAFCWGLNTFGQLGDGTATQRLTPVRVAGGLQWRQMSAGGDHVCAVTSEDKAYCWGMGFWGQLGDGTIAARRKPVQVAGGLEFRQITAGGKHSCGVTKRNTAYCWGDNNDGQLGDGTAWPPILKRLMPVAVLSGERRFDHVIAGGDHTCGVTQGDRVLCWGWNSSGELGDGTTDRRLTPVAVSGQLSVDQLSAVSNGTCVVTLDRRVFCWGDGRVTPVGIAGP